MIPYHIISTGSHGNAVLINNTVLVDCGVSYKALAPFVKSLKLVLLTHIHSDHFAPSTIRRLAAERPTLRFGCGQWLVRDLLTANVPAKCIDILAPDTQYNYGIVAVIPVPLVHNVPNCGYKLHFAGGRVLYATDTNNLNGITARNYDLYLIEANYEDDAIQRRIAAKKANGEYAYERQVLHNHLSKAKCDDFIYRNIGAGGEYVYLHQHIDKEKEGVSQYA